MENYPWYDEVEGKEQLAQGDFITSCPIIDPVERPSLTPNKSNTGIGSLWHDYRANKSQKFRVLEYDVTVMSQSCDLEHRKLELVLVCPFFALSEIEKQGNHFKSSKWKESVRQGNEPGYHMLKESKSFKNKIELSIVDFRSVYSIPYNSLVDIVEARGDRLRLLPPYREHLSQAFARFFMRVGLPEDIREFKGK